MTDQNQQTMTRRGVVPLKRQTLESMGDAMGNLANTLAEVSRLAGEAAGVCEALHNGIHEMLAVHDHNCDAYEQQQRQAQEPGLAPGQLSAIEQVSRTMNDLRAALTERRTVDEASPVVATEMLTPPSQQTSIDLSQPTPVVKDPSLPTDTLRPSNARTADDFRNFSGTTSFFCRVLSPAIAAAGKGMVKPSPDYRHYENNLETAPAEALLGSPEQEAWPTGFYTGGSGAPQFLVVLDNFAIYQPNLLDPMAEPVVVARNPADNVTRRWLPGELPPAIRGQLMEGLLAAYGLPGFVAEEPRQAAERVAELKTAAIGMVQTPRPTEASGFAHGYETAQPAKIPRPVLHRNDQQLYGQ